MKKNIFLILVALFATIGTYAQEDPKPEETTPDTLAKNHEISLSLNSLAIGLLGGDVNNSELSLYYTYKIKNSGIRIGVIYGSGDDGWFDLDSPYFAQHLYAGKYYGAKAGFIRHSSDEGLRLIYGLDLGFRKYEEETNSAYFNPDSINTIIMRATSLRNANQFMISPMLGVRFDLSQQIGISAECSPDIIFGKVTDEKVTRNEITGEIITDPVTTSNLNYFNWNAPITRLNIIYRF